MQTENIVKKVCKELGLTYKELGERIGYSEGSIRNMASKGEISEPVKKSIELLYELKKCQEQLEDCKQLERILYRLSKRGGDIATP